MNNTKKTQIFTLFFLIAAVFVIPSANRGNAAATDENRSAAQPNAGPVTTTSPAEATASGNNLSASDQLTQLLEREWQNRLAESPLTATQVGESKYNARLPRVSLADADRRAKQANNFLAAAQAIDTASLTDEQRVNQQLFIREMKLRITEHKDQTHLMPISGRTGFHISFPELRNQVPLENEQDYANYLSRLQAFGGYAAGYLQLMAEGVRKGLTVPAVVLEGWQESVDAQIVTDPTKSLFYEPLTEMPESISPAAQERLQARAQRVITTVVVPTYKRFKNFMETTYVPNCRATVGISALPGGRELYRHRVEQFTTLDISPEEVHQIGLGEVARIREEMDRIIQQVQFDGDFPAFVEHLRTDPQFQAKSAEELMQRTAMVLKKADGELPKLFEQLPRMPYGIREVPAYIAPKTTTAYYMRPAGDGTRAGFYYVNTYNLPARPTYVIEALSLHEAVPGHHLQIALSQELEGLPKFRRFGGFTVFIEGWGLYSERLGLEMGFYEDPYSDFGRLSMEIWRACRLVVDTGIHYLGWSREDAINFMKRNSAMSEHNIRAEVDRYIGWPGQALAYKIGELEIRKLRAEAEAKLGNKFDVRKFHRCVLERGSVPLDILRDQVESWIAKQMPTKQVESTRDKTTEDRTEEDSPSADGATNKSVPPMSDSEPDDEAGAEKETQAAGSPE